MAARKPILRCRQVVSDRGADFQVRGRVAAKPALIPSAGADAGDLREFAGVDVFFRRHSRSSGTHPFAPGADRPGLAGNGYDVPYMQPPKNAPKIPPIF